MQTHDQIRLTTNGGPPTPTPAAPGDTPGAPVAPAPDPLGRVASPIGQEATSVLYHFWVPPNTLVERTQLVRTESRIGDLTLCFYGIVDEVYRRSRKRSIDEEYDIYDGVVDYAPPFDPDGLTFACVRILRTEPPVYTPPMEQSAVYLGDPDDAALAYDYAAMREENGRSWGLPIGLLRNGARATVGVAQIDLRTLNGDRAGGLNVTGQAGAGTKSSFLLVVLRSLIDYAKRSDNGDPTGTPFSVRPILFNVKGTDLMYIDFPNAGLTAEMRRQWADLGLAPDPFTQAQFYAPSKGREARTQPLVERPVRDTASQTQPYYWTLADVIRYGLWTYLFSDETQANENLIALAEHVLDLLVTDCPVTTSYPVGIRLRDEPGVPQSFTALRHWLRDALHDAQHPVRDGRIYLFQTIRALVSRLGMVFDRAGQHIFDAGEGTGQPLRVLRQTTSDPLVIDVATLPPPLRRFVVAAVVDQVKEQQIGDRRVRGQVYFLVVDELGLYAPRGASDPITRLFEHVAAQLRSQGIILLGAQQQASKVSETVFGNSEIKVLGASSPVELEGNAWSRLLTSAQKTQALTLRPDNKMVLVDQGWMNIMVPYPAWAMKRADIPQDALRAAAPARLNLPEDAQ